MSRSYKDYVHRILVGQEVELSSSRILPTIAIFSLVFAIYIIMKIFDFVFVGFTPFKLWEWIFIAVMVLILLLLHSQLFVIASRRGSVYATSSLKRYKIDTTQNVDIKEFNLSLIRLIDLNVFAKVSFVNAKNNQAVQIYTLRKSKLFDQRYKLKEIFNELKSLNH